MLLPFLHPKRLTLPGTELDVEWVCSVMHLTVVMETTEQS